MSVDRRRLANNAPPKPLTPRLAASAAPSRNAPAPKLAGYTSPASTPTSTPSRRPLSTNISEANINVRIPDIEASVSKEHVPANITPRSSARKSRADSVQTTPTAIAADDTPGQRRPVSALSPAHVVRSRSPLSEAKAQTDLNRLSSPPSFAARVQQGQGYPLGSFVASAPGKGSPSAAPEEHQAYFFHADDAQRETKPPRPVLHKHAPSFVYANGEQERPEGPLQIPQPPSPPQSRPTSFTRSDSASASDSQPSTATSLFALTARQTLSPPAQTLNGALRAPSPPRQGIHLSYRKGASQIMRPSPLSPHSPSYIETRRRQSSIDGTEEERRRSRTMSVSSADSAARNPPNGFSLLHTFALPAGSGKASASPATSPTHADADAYAFPADQIHSPAETIDSGDGHPPLSESAANARRERKVLDLQISNSSLLAINRSLEKEVRKQRLELRRFRRLSRVRESLLSQPPPPPATDTPPADPDDDPDNDDDGDPYDEGSGGDDDEDSDDSAEDDDDDDDARHTASDRRRLVADLAAHRQLLADSSRLNQSILKCLGVSEALIRDGARALAYTVPLDEIRGRVLGPDDADDAASSSFVEGGPPPDDDDGGRIGGGGGGGYACDE